MGFFDFVGNAWDAVTHWAGESWRRERGAWSRDPLETFNKRAVPGLHAGALFGYEIGTGSWRDEDSAWNSTKNIAKTLGASAAPSLESNLNAPATDAFMRASNWAFKEVVSQPLSTVGLMAADLDDDGIGSLFSVDEWSKTYQEADKVSPGQALVFAVGGQHFDEEGFDPRNHQKVWKSNPWLRFTSGTLDLLANIFLDPTVVGGKIGKIGKARVLSQPFTGNAVVKGRKFVAGDQFTDRARRLAGMRSRFDTFADSIAKADSPTEIHQRYLKDHAYGGLLATSLWDVRSDPHAVGLVVRSAVGDDLAWKELTSEAPRIAERVGRQRAWFDLPVLSKNALDLSDDEFARLEAFRETKIQAFADAIANGKGAWGHIHPERSILVGEKQPRRSVTGTLRWGIHQASRWDAPQTLVPTFRKFMPSAKIVRMLDMNDPDSGNNFLIWLERSGLDRAEVTRLHAAYISKSSPQYRFSVAQQAEELAFRRLASKHGYSEAELNEVVPRINQWKSKSHRYLNNRPTYISDELRKRIEKTGDPDAVDPETKNAAELVDQMFMSALDEDGNLLLHERGAAVDQPLLKTQTADWLPMQDMRDLDFALGMYGKNKAQHAGYAAITSGVSLLDFARRQWQVAVLLRGGYPVRAASDEAGRMAALQGITPFLAAGAVGAGRTLNNMAWRMTSGGKRVVDWARRRREALIDEGIDSGVPDVVEVAAAKAGDTTPGLGVETRFDSMSEAVARGAVSSTEYFEWAKLNWQDMSVQDKQVLRSWREKVLDEKQAKYLLTRRALAQHGRGKFYEPAFQRATLDDATASGGFMVDPATGVRRPLEPENFTYSKSRRISPNITSEVTPAFKGGAPLFHGTNKRFEGDKLADINSHNLSGYKNLYGHGFYTTDDVEIARWYQEKGGATEEQTVYLAKWLGESEPKLLDLDAPLHPLIREWAEGQIGQREFDWPEEDVQAVLNEALSSATSGKAIDVVRRRLGDGVGDIPTYLVEHGYDGLKHVGGRHIGKKEHNVSIFFDTSKLKVTRYAPDAENVVAGRFNIDDLHDYIADHVDDLYHPDKFLAVSKTPNGQLRLSIAEAAKELDDDLADLRNGYAPERVEFGAGLLRYRERGAKNIRVRGKHGTYTFNGAFEGPDGQLKKAQASTVGDMNLYEHLAESEYGRWADATHDWSGSITPDKVEYDPGWTRAAVKQIGQDEVGRQFLRGRTVDDVVAWLEDNPRGRAYLGSMPHQASNYPRWAAAVKMLVDEYVPDVGDLRSRVLDGTATAGDLRRLVPEPDLPMVHGQTVDTHLSKSHAALKMAKKGVQKMMHVLGQVAPDKAARWPFFDKAYRAHLDVLVKAREAHVGDRVTVDELETLQRTAHQKALRDTRKWLYEVGTEYDAAHFMRNIVPFPNAVMDAFTKWTKIAVQEDPSVAARVWQVWSAPERHGLITDGQGRELDPDDHGNERWYEVDPASGKRTQVSGPDVGKDRYITFQAPSWAVANAFGKDVKVPVSIPKQSFNTIMNMPGAGPVVQMAVNEATLRDPQLWDNPIVRNFVLPYGPSAGAEGEKFLGLYTGTYKKALPASVQRVVDVIANSDEGQGTEYLTMSILQSEMVKYSLGDRDTKPTVKEARERAWQLKLVRLGASLTAPVSMTPHSPFKPYVDAHRQLMAKDPQNADRLFYERYGDELFWLTAKTTKNLSGMLASGQSHKLYKEYEGLIRQYPDLAGLIVGADGAGDFNKAVYEWQKTQAVSDGSGKKLRQVLSLAESAADVQERLGWIQYRKMRDQIDYLMADRGLTTLRGDAAADLKAMRDSWIESHKYVRNDSGEVVGLTPWYEDYSTFDMSKIEGRLVALRQIAKSPVLRNRADVEGLREYLWGRAQMKNVLAQSKYQTLGAQANAGLAQEWDSFVTDLRLRNPAFASLHSRWLSADDDLQAD